MGGGRVGVAGNFFLPLERRTVSGLEMCAGGIEVAGYTE